MKKKISLLCILAIMALTGCGETEVDKDNEMLLKDGTVRVEFSDVEILNN